MNSYVSFISQYGLGTIFTLTLFEYASFPMSSEIALPFSGAIASIAKTPYILVVAISVVAALFGTSICYWIGRIGGVNLLRLIKRKFPSSKAEIDLTCKRFHQYGASTVLISRLIPICRTYIGFIAGVAKIDYVTYLSSSLIGISLWNSFFIGLGYLLEDQWDSIIKFYTQYKNIIVSLIVLALLYAISRRRWRRNSHKSNETD